MEMREMTVTEGLVELKLMDKRIDKAIHYPWVTSNLNSNITTEYCNKVAEETKAAYQSAIDLINERKKIKAAIIKSNAETVITVAGVKMTVAEAIEYKSSIEYEKKLLALMMGYLANTTTETNNYNSNVRRDLDKLIGLIAGSDKADSAEAQKILAEDYLKRNGKSLIDPLDLQGKIDALTEKISRFEADVDVALTLANAKTVIAIE